MSDNNELIRKLRKSLDDLENDVREAKKALFDLEQVVKKDYKEVPGVIGIFDGFHLISETGEKYEVPGNYAAKSRLAYGDSLKLIEEDGKQLFKQITKVPRKKVEAVVNKKEGKWYALAETGSYRLSDAAATFHNLNVNDKITVIIPEDNPNAPFAALDKVPENVTKVTSVTTAPTETPRPAPAAPVVSGNSEHKSSSSSYSKPSGKAKRTTRSAAGKPIREYKAPAKADDAASDKTHKEFVEQIGASGTFTLGDDDLR